MIWTQADYWTLILLWGLSVAAFEPPRKDTVVRCSFSSWAFHALTSRTSLIACNPEGNFVSRLFIKKKKMVPIFSSHNSFWYNWTWYYRNTTHLFAAIWTDLHIKVSRCDKSLMRITKHLAESQCGSVNENRFQQNMCTRVIYLLSVFNTKQASCQTCILSWCKWRATVFTLYGLNSKSDRSSRAVAQSWWALVRE